MAPKKKEKNLKRSNIITLKLTDIELAVLNEAADVTGLSRSEYMRKLLLEKQINHQIEVVADMNDLRKLVSEYGKIGSNLNQIAKHFNSGGSQSRAIENEIHQCITDLFLLRKEVLKLAGGMNGNRKSTLKAEIQITQLLSITFCLNMMKKNREKDCRRIRTKHHAKRVLYG